MSELIVRGGQESCASGSGSCVLFVLLTWSDVATALGTVADCG